MLYDLLGGMADDVAGLNVFRYITFRTGGATVTALLISFLFGPRMIALLRARQRRGQPIREDGPQTHVLQKQGTPTMGGFLILVGLVPSVLLWADWSNRYVWIVLFVTLGFGAVGFADDYLKVSKISPQGVPGRVKLLFEFAIALVAMWALVLVSSEPLQTALTVPFFKTLLIQLGGFFFLFGALVIVGSSNAVNLTDGLDGLAIVPVMIAAASLGLIVYLVGNAVFADYLQIHFVPGTGELAVFCGALIGAGLGFLWYNAP
ncbi:MAG: phospho-N-acetylmuramoyl-pentapeptide-transferase, partial [Alphaproteobacteria bacterium HGW-Alphaproteobacteria-12]